MRFTNLHIFHVRRFEAVADLTKAHAYVCKKRLKKLRKVIKYSRSKL